MINNTLIKINGIDYHIKKSFGSLLLFEEMTGKSVYKINETLNDIITLFYCILVSNNDNFKFTLKEFVKILDDNEDSIILFNDYLQSEVKETVPETVKKENQISVSDIYKILVYSCKIDPKYFLNEMSEYEANLLIDINYENYKSEWEKHRWSSYINAVCLGAKLKSPQDLLKFSWELEEKDDDNVNNRTEDEIREVQELMLKKMLGNG